MPSIFLYAPQDFRNLCVLARSLEAFGCEQCFVFDPHRLIRERYGKARTRELRTVSAGAFSKLQWKRIDQPAVFVAGHPGRVVAAVTDPTATALFEHRFDHGDLLTFGSESQGLPAEIIAASSAKVTIPLAGATQSLNLAVALGVVLFEVTRQLRAVAAPRGR